MLEHAEIFVRLMKIVWHLMSQTICSTVILIIKIQQVIIEVLAKGFGLVISSKQRPMLLPIPKLKEMKLPLPILKLKKPLPLPNLIKMPPMDPLEKKLNPNILYLLVCA